MRWSNAAEAWLARARNFDISDAFKGSYSASRHGHFVDGSYRFIDVNWNWADECLRRRPRNLAPCFKLSQFRNFSFDFKSSQMNWASGAPVMKGSSACTVVSAAKFHSCKQGHKTGTNLLSNKVADFNMQKRKIPYPETSPQTLGWPT